VTTRSGELLRRGVAAAERGRVREGLELIRGAIAADPADAEAHAQHGRFLSRLHRDAEAVAAAERALALAPTAAVTLDTIGVVLSRAGLHERAVACFRQAAAADPARASLYFNFAASLKVLGRFDEAERAYESCLEREPRYWRAHSALSQLRRQTKDRNHVERLESLLAGVDLDADAELHLRHALAKELEDLGRYSDAFAELAAGKARRRATLGYAFERDRELFDAVAQLFPDPIAPPTPGAALDAPIFVVGMPRTGTTLVDRILSSHSLVASAGESQNFGVLMKRAAGTPSPRVLDVETVTRSMSIDLPAVGRAYVERTRPGGDKPRFVDKMPLNFFYLGHVARALPGARLVVVRRHPLDTCLGNFRQLFALGQSYYDYAYDLLDTGRYFLAFARLMGHWQRVLPGRIHELVYEQLVADPRGETGRLLAHCGLEWEDGCVAFERNPAAVATASAVQVREPLHARSVGRWRHYERELQPLIRLLAEAGVAAGESPA
jgi:tetratricopeptide (TPR) repeat protein